MKRTVFISKSAFSVKKTVSGEAACGDISPLVKYSAIFVCLMWKKVISLKR